MIRVTGLNKYYHKGKINELHVLNNISLELPETGLVCFLGKSGSGKTTLLNVIGGLDKQNSGEISYHNQVFTKYKMDQIDKYRREKIGYIFQNYLLLEDKSVFENLRITLDIIGINNLDEQNKRIEYALKAVGLYKYRKKQAGKLSGGEQQRVSIARSLVKNCEVIIADEPTGNLDSENTIEIMNILKTISRSTLVLLVTHNEEMARSFADRIIKIKDGSIVEDFVNENKSLASNKSEKKIYLKDFHQEILKTDNLNIEVYQEEKKDINLRLVIKNDVIYLESNNRIINTNDNGITLLNEHYEPEIKVNKDDFDFDISWYNDKKEYNFFHNLLVTLKEAFKNFANAKKKTKIFRVIFFIIGTIIASSVISYTNYRVIDTSKFINEDSYCIYKDTNGYYDYMYNDNVDFEYLIEEGYVTDVYNFSAINHYREVQLNSIIKKEYSFEAYYYPYSVAKGKKMIIGEKPGNKNEIVLSKKIVQIIMENEKIKSYQKLIGYQLEGLIVTGIVDSEQLVIYTNDLFYRQAIEDHYSMLYDMLFFGYEDEYDYQLTAGTKIINNDTDLLLNEDLAKKYNLQVGDKVKFSIILPNLEFTIVGLFKTDYEKINYENKYGIITNNKLLMKYALNLNDSSKLEDNITVTQSGYYFDYQIVNYDKLDTVEDINFRLIEGKIPSSSDEVLVSCHLGYQIGDAITIYDKNYKIVGTYSIKGGINNIELVIANNEGYLLSIASNPSRGFYSLSYQIAKEEQLKEYLKQRDLTLKKTYDCQYETTEKINKEDKIMNLVKSIVMLAASVVYVFFSTRARVLNNVKEVGVYRSIGKTRFQIIKSYLADIIVETSLTSLLGYVLTIIGVLYLNNTMKNLLGINLVNVNHLCYFMGFIIIYLVNILIGLLPIFHLLANTPSEINSKYDF